MIVEALESVVAAAFEAGGIRADITPGVISAAQSRLGAVLPEALTDYYRVAGRYDGMMKAHSRFLSPTELSVQDAHVVFCRENQHVMEWGIRIGELGLPNPTVYGQMSDGPDVGTWWVESATLSAFLLGFGSWQAVMSGDESAECEFPEDNQPMLAEWFDPVGAIELRQGGPLVGYVDEKRHIVAAHDVKHAMLYVGTSVEDGLEEFERRSGLELNWY